MPPVLGSGEPPPRAVGLRRGRRLSGCGGSRSLARTGDYGLSLQPDTQGSPAWLAGGWRPVVLPHRRAFLLRKRGCTAQIAVWPAAQSSARPKVKLLQFCERWQLGDEKPLVKLVPVREMIALRSQQTLVMLCRGLSA